MKIKEVAEMTKVTVRTLQYYDKIGLLHPSETTKANYRIYQETDLERLQQILFFKELDFPLAMIKEIMLNPHYDKQEVLKKQKELLLQKKKHLDGLLALVDKTIEGEEKMSFKEFDMSEIEKHKKQYAKEVKERWGNTSAYAESMKKTDGYDAKEWETITREANQIFAEFYEERGKEPSCEMVQSLVERWKNHITKYYYDCTNEILAGLGLMYTQDERFRQNIDQNGEGTADFMAKAIAVYCEPTDLR